MVATGGGCHCDGGLVRKLLGRDSQTKPRARWQGRDKDYDGAVPSSASERE